MLGKLHGLQGGEWPLQRDIDVHPGPSRMVSERCRIKLVRADKAGFGTQRSSALKAEAANRMGSLTSNQNDPELFLCLLALGCRSGGARRPARTVAWSRL
jgi:hypothetical protein